MKYLFTLSILLCTSLSAQQQDYDLVLTEYASGRYEEALMAIERCIIHDTTNYRYFLLKGRILENLYRYDEAIITQEKALQLNPDDGMEAQAALATLYLLTGQPAASAQLYEQLATAKPQVTRWKVNWATALQASGKPKGALEQLKIVTQTDTTNWLVYKNLGDCYYRLDSLWQAFHCYYCALKLYPNNKNLYGMLTRILTTNDQIEGAIEVGKEAVTIHPTNVEAWKYLGIAYYKSGDARKAYNALQKALALGDSSFTAISHFGVISYHLRFYDQAEKSLLKAHQLDPKDINTMNYLASTYGINEKPQKGLDVLNELDNIIASFDSIGMRANMQRGYLLRILKRYDEAIDIYITATKVFPQDLRNFYEVAVCYDLVLNKRSAFDWYTRYLEKIDPNWATKKWTEQELNKYEFATFSMNRVKLLKVDLFFEEEKR